MLFLGLSVHVILKCYPQKLVSDSLFRIGAEEFLTCLLVPGLILTHRPDDNSVRAGSSLAGNKSPLSCICYPRGEAAGLLEKTG